MSKKKTHLQMAGDLIDYFVFLYIEKYNHKPIINRYQSKFQVVDLLKDFSYDDLRNLLDYYFGLNANHSVYDFVISYHQISDLKHEAEKDAELRRKSTEITKIRVEKYRQEKLSE